MKRELKHAGLFRKVEDIKIVLTFLATVYLPFVAAILLLHYFTKP